MDAKNRNLIVRVVTALVLLPIVLGLIWVGGLPFTLLVCVAAALGALELNLLPTQQAAAVVTVTAPPAEEGRRERKKAKAAAREAEVRAPGSGDESGAISGAALASIGAAFLVPLLNVLDFPGLSLRALLAALLVIAFTDALLFERELQRAPTRVGFAVMGPIYLGIPMAALDRLRGLEHGIWWIVLALAVTWLNDTGAYFSGRAFGRHKLYERISPSKTWEGAIGGFLASVAGAVAVKLLGLPTLPLWGAALIGAGAGILGPVGDLSESMLKRAVGAKDSGKLLPGHGGMLDRIDALLFNAPFVLIAARLLA
jgi:phosphatidate cytidylyltransferase